MENIYLRLKKYFIEKKLKKQIDKISIQLAKLEHYSGVEKNNDPRIFENYLNFENEKAYLISRLRGPIAPLRNDC